MPRGGKRAGAGRKKGATTKKTAAIAQAAAANPGTVLPLNHMLSILNDPNATQARKDRAAEMSAPYLHPRLNAVAATIGGMPNSGGPTTLRPINIVIVSVPRGGQYNEKTGMIVYPDGTEADPPPFVPFRPTPDITDELPALDYERAELDEPAEPEPTPGEEVADDPKVESLAVWRRRSGDD